MTQLELLDKRRHIMKFSDDNIPPKSVIEDILWKSWKVTPSKNSFMPYHVNVLGPDKVEEKKDIWQKSQNNNDTQNTKNFGAPNPVGNQLFLEHLSSAPYLLVFSQRVCEPNGLIAKNVEAGAYYQQMHEDEADGNQQAVGIEVGMFHSNLTAFALEAGLDTSCILCFPSDRASWTDMDFVEGHVLLLMSVGYSELARRDFLTEADSALDKKPEPEEVIRWI
tara:strand:- start:2513 stop:3178 length:666 start_codon:yes stop_codon:yes gene_type:complete